VARESKQPPKSSVRRRATAQDARVEFVLKHGIACFKCGAATAEWAKTGLGARGASGDLHVVCRSAKPRWLKRQPERM
jgi:hypothetical protein